MSTEPADLAPHVDAAWADAFVIELRLRDVPGDVIGDVLTEVDSHVVDSGTSADDAFGDPVQYAAQVAEGAARPSPDRVRETVPPALGGGALVVEVSSPVSQLTWAVEGDRVLLLYDCREEEQYMALTQCVPTPDAFHSCLVESDGDALAWPGAPPGAAMIRRSSGRATRTNRR